MLVKMKECREAIKNMVSFDKSSNTVETARRAVAALANKTSLSAIDSGLKTSVSLLSDIIRFSSNAFKDKELESEEIRRKNSISNSLEKELNTSTEVNDSLNRFLTSNDATSSSLKSFLMLEKQVMEEVLNEEKAFTIKRKISAEPFLSYTEETAEFVWTDETETSLSGRVLNSSEQLNSSDINFGNPRMNSTFCEYSLVNIHRASSSFRNYDSGFENHFSI